MSRMSEASARVPEPRFCQRCREPVVVYRYRKQWRFPRLCVPCQRAVKSLRSGEASPRWAGGRHPTKAGYIRVRVANNERDLEHRVVWMATHGPIPPGFEVHHKNRDKADNRLENLELLYNPAHREEHRAERSLNGRWSLAWDACRACKEIARPHQADGLCKRCYQREHPKPQTERTCEACGGIFTVSVSEVRRGHGRFCSHRCTGKGAPPPPVRTGEQNHSAKLTATTVREMRRQHADGLSQPKLARQFGVSLATVSAVVLRRTWKHVE